MPVALEAALCHVLATGLDDAQFCLAAYHLADGDWREFPVLCIHAHVRRTGKGPTSLTPAQQSTILRLTCGSKQFGNRPPVSCTAPGVSCARV